VVLRQDTSHKHSGYDWRHGTRLLSNHPQNTITEGPKVAGVTTNMYSWSFIKLGGKKHAMQAVAVPEGRVALVSIIPLVSIAAENAVAI